MPSTTLESSTDSPGKYVEPHERANGPWKDHELADAARSVHHVHKIAKNKKFMGAIKKHMESEAEEKHQSARQIDMLARSGKISEKQLEHLKAKRG